MKRVPKVNNVIDHYNKKEATLGRDIKGRKYALTPKEKEEQKKIIANFRPTYKSEEERKRKEASANVKRELNAKDRNDYFEARNLKLKESGEFLEKSKKQIENVFASSGLLFNGKIEYIDLGIVNWMSYPSQKILPKEIKLEVAEYASRGIAKNTFYFIRNNGTFSLSPNRRGNKNKWVSYVGEENANKMEEKIGKILYTGSVGLAKKLVKNSTLRNRRINGRVSDPSDEVGTRLQLENYFPY